MKSINIFISWELIISGKIQFIAGSETELKCFKIIQLNTNLHTYTYIFKIILLYLKIFPHFHQFRLRVRKVCCFCHGDKNNILPSPTRHNRFHPFPPIDVGSR